MVAFELALDIIAWTEIVLRFHRPQEKLGLLDTEKSRIREGYLKGLFYWDLLTALPLEVIGLSLYGARGYFSPWSTWRNSVGLVHPIWRTNKLMLVRHADHLFTECFKMVYIGHPLTIRISRTFFAFVTVTHYVACAFLLVHFYEGPELTRGFTQMEYLYKGEIWQQYFLAYDYSIKSMVGMSRPGKPMPQTDLQAFYAITVAVCGVALFATVLATISNLVAEDVSVEQKYKSKMNQVSDVLSYMSRSQEKGLPREFISQVRGFYTQVFRFSRILLGRIDEIFQDLPMQVALRVEQVVGGDTMRRVPMFQEASRDPAFLHFMLSKMEPVTFCQGEIVMRKGEEGDAMFFLIAGAMGVVGETSEGSGEGDVVFVLKQGSFLGEIALLHDCLRTATIKALTYCSAFRLTKASFEEAQKKFPEAIALVHEAARDRLQKIKLEDIVKKVPLFEAAKSDPAFIEEVVGCLNPRGCPPETTVVRKGEVGTEMFFIAHGELNVMLDSRVVHTLRDGAFFGEVGLLYDTRRTATIVAKTYCDLFTLKQADFRKVMAKFPEQSKGIEEIARERYRTFVREGLMRKIPLFQAMSELPENGAFLEEVASCLRILHFEASEVVVAAFSEVNQMFFVCRGVLDLVNNDDEPLQTYSEGEYFCEMGLCYPTTSPHSVVAQTPCELYVFTKDTFLPLEEKYPDAARPLRDLARKQFTALIFEILAATTTSGLRRAYFNKLHRHMRLLHMAALQQIASLAVAHSRADSWRTWRHKLDGGRSPSSPHPMDSPRGRLKSPMSRGRPSGKKTPKGEDLRA
eukprot:Sspe_Gene.94510::Locus_66883_Transcript_1_1_Confidence_1.000_Length_2498::g.94510::m.94510/K04950/CNGA3; cyclic nucleotide gated channel alpha 3